MAAKDRVFLSHASADKGVADRLRTALQSSGYPVMSDENISMGDNFADAISRALGDAKTIVLLITPNSEKSANTWFELGMAHAMATSNNATILPVLAGGRMPSSLDGILYVDGGDSTADQLADKVVAAVTSAQRDKLDRVYEIGTKDSPVKSLPGFRLSGLYQSRVKLGLSVDALAREAKVDHATIRRIEHGRSVRRQTCIRLIQALKRLGMMEVDLPKIE